MTVAFTETLAVAVPAQIERLREQGGPNDVDRAKMREAAQRLVEHSDVLLYESDEDGESAGGIFNELAHALAVLAYTPGGVKAFGHHWEVT